MALGSWLRFFIGILLSIEMIRLIATGNGSFLGAVLAIIYFILVALYFLIKN